MRTNNDHNLRVLIAGTLILLICIAASFYEWPYKKDALQRLHPTPPANDTNEAPAEPAAPPSQTALSLSEASLAAFVPAFAPARSPANAPRSALLAAREQRVIAATPLPAPTAAPPFNGPSANQPLDTTHLSTHALPPPPVEDTLLAGTVFFDENDNGMFDFGTDFGIANVPVRYSVALDPEGPFIPLLETISDEDGDYALNIVTGVFSRIEIEATDLFCDTWRFHAATPSPGPVFSSPDEGPFDFGLIAGNHRVSGNLDLMDLAGSPLVFTNLPGPVQTEILQREIYVWNGSNQVASTTLLPPAAPDDTPWYAFTNIAPGSYRIDHDANSSLSHQLEGAFTLTLDECTTPALPEIILRYDPDFGTYRLSGVVWLDLNFDGVPDENIDTTGIAEARFRYNGTLVPQPASGAAGAYVIETTTVLTGSWTADVSHLPLRLIPTTLPHRSGPSVFGVHDVVHHFGFIPAPPALTVESFTAQPSPAGTQLNWITIVEDGIFLYRIFRATSINGGRINVSNQGIFASGNSTGGTYQFTDLSAAPAARYYYYLEAIDLSLETYSFGPVLVRPAAR